ncbi:MerR family transcriptional regulator [Kitasatospora sp. NPDC004240]
MDRTNLLPIGQFAQASGLPITALRHYDAGALLAPALVDPVSGYRYYRRDQLRTAQLIRSLRQLDVPLERVRELVARREAGREITGALREWLAAAERRLELQRTVVRGLLNREHEGEDMKHRVTIREGAAERVLACRGTVGQAELNPFMRESFQAMYTVAGRAPLTFAGPAFARLHGPVTEEHSSQVEACLPFSATAAQPADLPEGMIVIDLPANLFASTVVEGPAAAYPEVLSAYDAVATWIAEHSFAFAGPVREVYRHWSGEPGHPDNVLEIVWPVEEPGHGPDEGPAAGPAAGAGGAEA